MASEKTSDIQGINRVGKITDFGHNFRVLGSRLYTPNYWRKLDCYGVMECAVFFNLVLLSWFQPVNLYPASEAGFCDVFGNVWEWIEDHFNGFGDFKAHLLYDDFSTPCFDGRHNMIMVCHLNVICFAQSHRTETVCSTNQNAKQIHELTQSAGKRSLASHDDCFFFSLDGKVAGGF